MANHPQPADYLTFLRQNPAEQDALYQDLLIPVTSFFRDPGTFKIIAEAALPLLTSYQATGTPLRVWVAGCSTGQEAYSVAMCFREFFGEEAPPIQLFGTDLSEPAIAKARAGLYTLSEVTPLSPLRLKTFFTRTEDGYRVIKSIRDMCVFARHDLLKDPPFGKIDFISCRNVLIYMDAYLQKKALTTFHYALNNRGLLWLGRSETIGSVPALFSVGSIKSANLFTRRDVPGGFMPLTSNIRRGQPLPTPPDPKTDPMRPDYQKTADELILNRYTPAGVVVNGALDVVHFRGSTAAYLEQAPGKPTHNLLLLARQGLAFELRNLLHKAKKTQAQVSKENIPVGVNGSLSSVTIEAMPLPGTLDPHYLVLFHPAPAPGPEPPARKARKGTAPAPPTPAQVAHVTLLEKELAQAREDMRSITEDQEAVNEELQSANEELLSGSEELQSLNEELETSKEELQSTNEELLIYNQEMASLNQQLTASRDYCEAIIGNIREPLLVLDRALHVRTANRAFYQTYSIDQPDIEGELIYNLGRQEWDIPELRTLLEQILPEKTTVNDFELTHAFAHIGQRVMLLNARELIRKTSPEALILLSIEDITDRKRAQNAIQESAELFRKLVTNLPAPVYSCDANGYLVFFNEAAAVLWGLRPELGKARWCGSERLFRPDGTPLPLNASPMAIALREQRTVPGEELMVERPDGSRSYIMAYSQPEFDWAGTLTGATNVAFDVTESVEATRKLVESEQNFRQLAELMPQKIASADAHGTALYYNLEWLTYSGLTQFDLLRQGWHQLVHPDEQSALLGQWKQALETGTNFEMVLRLRHKDGEYRWHLSRSSPVREETGAVYKWLIVSTQIQEQVEQRELLTKAVALRTHELLTANELLEANNQSLQRINKELDAFAYVTSHDLQEPLRKIQTLAGRIHDTEQANLTPTGQDYFRRIQTAAGRMQQLIRDLLAFSQLSAVGKPPQSVDLNQLTGEVLTELDELMTENRAEVLVGQLGQANVIEYQFRQLLHNLLSNALKFSVPGTLPRIRVDRQTGTGREFGHPQLLPNQPYCLLTVADNGIGFEPQYGERIFGVFQRLHGRDQYEGTGIGLAIVKKIVENHKGLVLATGQPNQGATFSIYIPLS